MRSDLDRLMAERDLDAFIIPSVEGRNPYRDYLTGGVHTAGMVIKKRDEAPRLIVNHMEIDEAKRSGLPVQSLDDFDYGQIAKEHGRGTPAAQRAFWLRVMNDLEITGRVTFYGMQSMQATMRLIELFENDLADHITLTIDQAPDIFSVAYETKDPDELAKLRASGERSSAAMRAVREWLSTHRADGEQIVNADGEPLTIGAVKRFVRLTLLEHDMEDTEGLIFAQGRDAGVPHSRGQADEVLRPGESIVFDLFPCPVGGGYYHDMTRTWSLGWARDEVQRDFNLVHDIFLRSLEGLTLGEPTNRIATQICEWFEAAGHPTRLSTPNTQSGYVHSLGHGLGLNVHESPGMSHLSSDKTLLRPGNTLTIEPGLYYPDKGYGIRIEDTIYLDEAGQVHNLTDCPYELVVPLNG